MPGPASRRKICMLGLSAGLAVSSWALVALAQPSSGAPSSVSPASGVPSSGDTRAAALGKYRSALAGRRLDAGGQLSRDVIRERLLSAQEFMASGRRDEVIAMLSGLVESPRFVDFADSDEGHAATYALGDALASAGAYDPARGYLKRLLSLPPTDTYARRAVRRLVEIGIDSDDLGPIVADLKGVPEAGQPEETRGEIAYLKGRERQLAGDPVGAIASFATITQRSRFWAQAAYLSGLIEVDRGNFKQGENLFCKVADPSRSDKTAPFFADDRFFAVRDLSRLALGRVAHEQFRFDDSRYYYYLVPQDSDRLAEALYESATGRYEKKDYEAARDLLDELKALNLHHRYEDEAWILSSYIDLARCKFDAADASLKGFIARYEPVRDAARALMTDDRAMARLIEASRTGADPAGADTGRSPEAVRAIAALLRVDASYGFVSRRLAELDHEMSGMRGAMGQIDDMQRALATVGGVRPASEEGNGEKAAEQASRVGAELDGVRRQIDALEQAHASNADLAPLRAKVDELEQRVRGQRPRVASSSPAEGGGTDLPDLLRADRILGSTLYQGATAARAKLAEAQAALAKDAVARLSLRLSRLLRRARLGRIESVLGRKRSLELEVEALATGLLPKEALDSLQAVQYLKDSEEYWPFEGDDWPDEYVGGEGLR